MSSFFNRDETSFQNFVTESLDDVHQKINLILQYLNIFYIKEKTMAFDLSSVLAQVQQEKTVELSLVNLVTGLNQKIAELAANVVDETAKAQLAELTAAITANINDMQTAVTANTPAATTPAEQTTTPDAPASTTTTSPVSGNAPVVGSDATTVNPPAADAPAPTVVTPEASTTQDAPVATPTVSNTPDTPAADAAPVSNT